ncbi:hypothetical protein ACFQ69_36750 [Streptomyces sp. NPDC056470]|uniref:hypothetical protein n=1 Tax=Streptomyces sp. NPDC056470 TaxID=3345831 RepID=UPI0036A23835
MLNRTPPGVDTHINLACSGATAKHVFRATDGGQGFKGESPQADRLRGVAQQYNVKAVVLSIGADDFGVPGFLDECKGVTTSCYNQQDAVSRDRVEFTKTMVSRAIDNIREAMAAAGYGASGYKLIVRGYASPLPPLSEFESNRQGRGCDFNAHDADWFSKTLFPRLNTALWQTAYYKGAQFLDVSGAMRGHELCNRDTVPVKAETFQQVESLEWVNKLYSGTPDAGRKSESYYPNFEGAAALQQCVSKAYAGTGHQKCRSNGPHATGVTVEPLLAASSGSEYMQSGDTLSGSQCKYSPNGKIRMCMLTNGVLAVQTGSNFSTTLWDTHETLMTGLATKFHEGHLWVESVNGNIVWTNQGPGNPGAYLKVENDGRAIVYNVFGFPLWATTYPPGYVPPPPPN